MRSSGARHGLVMAAALFVAGALDYGANVLAGRWLEPVDFGTFVSVSALLQIVLILSITIRTVTAFYTADLSARTDAAGGVGAFVRFAWRWAWRWGLVASAVMALASPVLARWLRLPSVWPLLAASPMLLMLFLRETGLGTVQGLQAFGAFGLAQVAQATLRVVLVAALIAIGGGAAGAIGAQPLAALGAVAVVLWAARSYLKPRQARADVPVVWRYSVHTLVGLAAFGVLTNLDALFVKRFFSPGVAGDYAPVITVAKICLFLPWAVALVLFPKVAHRRAAGLDARPILLLALGAALTPGLLVSALCFTYPDLLVTAVFGARYPDPGVVLGLATLAATLYAGIFIWLNYSLSLERKAFVYALVGVLAWQAGGMFLFGRESLVSMALTMVSAGLLGNVAGYAAAWSGAPAASPAPAVANGR